MKWLKSFFKEKPPIDELIGSWTSSGYQHFKRDIHHLLCFQSHGKGYYEISNWVHGDNPVTTTNIEWKRINESTIMVKKCDGTDEVTITYSINTSANNMHNKLELQQTNRTLKKSSRIGFWIIEEVLYKDI
jgi:hypothetical protein